MRVALLLDGPHGQRRAGPPQRDDYPRRRRGSDTGVFASVARTGLSRYSRLHRGSRRAVRAQTEASHSTATDARGVAIHERDAAARCNGKLTVLPGEYVGGGLRVEKAPALVPDHSTTVTVRNNLVTMRAQREKEGSQKGSRGFFPTATAAQS